MIGRFVGVFFRYFSFNGGGHSGLLECLLVESGVLYAGSFPLFFHLSVLRGLSAIVWYMVFIFRKLE